MIGNQIKLKLKKIKEGKCILKIIIIFYTTGLKKTWWGNLGV